MHNNDDNELLEFWAEQTSVGYFEYMTGIDTDKLKTVDLDEAFDALSDKFQEEYEPILLSRIQYCEKLLKSTQDKRIFFILARLYDQYMVEGNMDHLYKRIVRYYAIKAIRADRSLHKAWCLLGQAYSFIALIGGNEGVPITGMTIIEGNEGVPLTGFTVEMGGDKSNEAKPGGEAEDVKKIIRYYEKAIFCYLKALKIFPQNPTYKRELKRFYSMRDQAYKDLPEICNRDFLE